jgi:hypothetical protein
MILTIISIIFISIIISLLVIIRIQIKRQQIYERWILDTQNLVNNTYITIKDLDHKQIFEKDDEVGVVFSQIVEVIEHLNNIVSGE